MTNHKMKIDLSEEDLQRLLSGEAFDWVFPATKGKEVIEVDIHLYNSEKSEVK